MPSWRLTRGTRDRISPDRAVVPSARRYEDRVKLGPDGETVPATCTFCLDRARTLLCGEPVWEGQACLPHYIRKGLYKEGLLRKFKPSNWKEKREVQTFMHERDSIVAFFQARLRAIRYGNVEPVRTFSDAYTILDNLWDTCHLNRRLPQAERIAKFVAFITRQDYIAKHGWHYRDWNGDKANIGKRKEAQNDSSTMEANPAFQAERVLGSVSPELGPGDAMGDSEQAGRDKGEDWFAPDSDERLPNGGA